MIGFTLGIANGLDQWTVNWLLLFLRMLNLWDRNVFVYCSECELSSCLMYTWFCCQQGWLSCVLLKLLLPMLTLQSCYWDHSCSVWLINWNLDHFLNWITNHRIFRPLSFNLNFKFLKEGMSLWILHSAFCTYWRLVFGHCEFNKYSYGD